MCVEIIKCFGIPSIPSIYLRMKLSVVSYSYLYCIESYIQSDLRSRGEGGMGALKLGCASNNECMSVYDCTEE